MKKVLLFALILTLTGCAAPPGEEEAAAVLAPAPTLRLGLAVTAHVSGSMHATESFPGRAHTELTAAAVLVDQDGVIRRCAVDGVRAILFFDGTGTLLTAPGTLFPSKNTLGADYGMHKASSLGTEWQAQAAAFAAHCVGKTARQLCVGDTVTSVTVSTDGLYEAVLLAAEKAAFAAPLAAADGLHLACRGVSLPGSAAAGERTGLAAVRLCAAACATHGGTVTGQQTAALLSALPFTAAGRLACATDGALSPLSPVLYPVSPTAQEAALLREMCLS